MKYLIRLSAMIMYYILLFIALGSEINNLISVKDIISLFIGSCIFLIFLLVDKNKPIKLNNKIAISLFWSGFFVSIINLISLFEARFIQISISDTHRNFITILINLRALLYAIGINILIYQNENISIQLTENKKANNEKISELTNRESEICEQIALGKSNKEIGEMLCISPFTVKKHVYNIFSKLEISQRSEIKYLINRNRETN